jgi:hypothetical protein
MPPKSRSAKDVVARILKDNKRLRAKGVRTFNPIIERHRDSHGEYTESLTGRYGLQKTYFGPKGGRYRLVNGKKIYR